MNDYSKRSLTACNDKIPAILGLVDVFGKASHDEWVFGLWKGDFLPGLLLFRDEASPSEAIQKVPSWSWLGVSGSIFWSSIIYHVRERMSTCVQVISLNEASGSVVMKGRFMRFHSWDLENLKGFGTRSQHSSQCATPHAYSGIWWDFDPTVEGSAKLFNTRNTSHRKLSKCSSKSGGLSLWSHLATKRALY